MHVLTRGAAALLLLVLGLQAAQAQEKKLSLQHIFMGLFFEQGLSDLNWTKDGSYYTAREGNKIIRYDIKDDKVKEVLFDGSKTDPQVELEGYSFSADEKKLLLQTEFKSIYRHSFTAEYYVYDFESKEVTPLSKNGAQSYATFSPSADKVAFTRNNNLFVVDLKTMEEKAITTTGKPNHIIHGSTDWVHEEEFGFPKAFFWSPDGQKIAYYTFDESHVKEYNMQVWRSGPDNPYPYDYRFKYPKAGERNATTEITIFHLDGSKKVKVDIGEEKDIYIPRLKWTRNANTLAVYHLNRLQNHLQLMHADAESGKTSVVYSEKDPDGYVDIEYADDLYYFEDGKHFLMSSEREGYKHFYLYTIEGKLVRKVTEGEWEVADFLGVDESEKTPVIYYTSTEVSPVERHFYRIDIKGKKKEKLSQMRGMNSVSMSKDFSYYILTNSSAETPKSIRLFDTKKNSELSVLVNNADKKETHKEFGLAKKELFTVKARDGVELHGYMYRPTNFDTSKKYPVLMHVYGGPSSQEVTDSWSAYPNDLWHQLLVQEGYVVVCVDNRGTDAKGAAFKKATYGQLGKFEVQDQIDVAKYLMDKPWVDQERIGIWGWSYGGYMTSLCMTVGADYFKAGIAVAPVTTWRYYDTIYTERFLKRPQDNPSGYDDNSPINHADKLQGNFLLIHGTGDDNVHIQNALLFSNALIAANKQFDMFYYPDRNHGIYGGITRYHLYQMMTNWVKENL